MIDRDHSYYARRLAEERLRADRAAQPEVRRIHADLAERYASLLQSRTAGSPLSTVP